jgi:hypothetical protein
MPRGLANKLIPSTITTCVQSDCPHCGRVFGGYDRRAITRRMRAHLLTHGIRQGRVIRLDSTPVLLREDQLTPTRCGQLSRQTSADIRARAEAVLQARAVRPIGPAS